MIKTCKCGSHMFETEIGWSCQKCQRSIRRRFADEMDEVRLERRMRDEQIERGWERLRNR